MQHGELEARLEAAKCAAFEAGKLISVQTVIDVEHKGTNDFVTQMDRASEQLIVSSLAEKFPLDGFYGEELGSQGNQKGRWIIDPIDGTTNYIKSLPLYTVSIAYEFEGELVLGVVYCPGLHEMFSALKGHGAFRNDTPISVSNTINAKLAVVGMSFAHRIPEGGARMLRLLPHLMAELSDMRRSGSAALDLCFVACGRYDAFLELGLFIYDYAAGLVIVREASGMVTGWSEDDLSTHGNVLATNGHLHNWLKQLIKKV